MSLLLWGMLLALLIPIAQVCRPCSVWERMAALSSISSKVALIILVVAVVRSDWMIGLVGAIALSAGNAGILLLANVLREVER